MSTLFQPLPTPPPEEPFFLQLIQNRSQFTANVKGQNVTSYAAFPDEMALDQSYPYPAGKNNGYAQTGWLTDAGNHWSGDTPTMPIYGGIDAQGNGVGIGIINAQMDMAFQTYVMYIPPGTGFPVPLAENQWSLHVGGQPNGGGKVAPFGPAPGENIPNNFFQGAFDEPVWDDVFNHSFTTEKP